MSKLTASDIIRPQPGAQARFSATVADIGIYGGAAGCGKTYALLLEGIRLFPHDGVEGLILRRKATDIRMPGAIWSEACKLYPKVAHVKANETLLKFSFNRNSSVRFTGYKNPNDVSSLQGAAPNLLCLDELTQFTRDQFWFAVGRTRDASGIVKPYVRATCNPEKCWVYELLDWWIDKKSGYPIPERAGVLRWLLRYQEVIYWFNTQKEAIFWRDQNGWDNKIRPLSLTFIPGTINDNQILLKNDPSYLAKLAALPEEEKMRFLYGRWLFQPKGKLFKPDWFQYFAIPPAKPEVLLVTTDTACCTETANDYSVFQLWARHEGKIYLLSQIRGKFKASEQLRLLINIILVNKVRYSSIEPAASGFYLIDELTKKTGVIILKLSRRGKSAKENKPGQYGSSGDKFQRAYEVQEYVERGFVYLNPEADYYSDLMGEVAAFAPENKDNVGMHDDQVDCLVDAIQLLLIDKIGYNNPENISLTPHYIRRRR